MNSQTQSAMSANKTLKSHFGKIEKSRFIELAEQWEKEKSWKERSQHIALELIDFLEDKNLTQKAFAELMNVSPQAVNKWLRGQENFTLETIGKMEAVLKRKLIEVVSNDEDEDIVKEELEPITEEYVLKTGNVAGVFRHSAKVIAINSDYSQASGC